MNRFTIKLGLLAALMTGSAVSAAPVIFDTRADFIAATTPEAYIDFDDVDNVSFAGGNVGVANLNLSGPFDPVAPNDPFYVNFIGTSVVPEYSIDGTQAVYGASLMGASMRIDFLTPVTSFGADFVDLGDEERITLMNFLDEDDTSIGKILVQGFGDLEGAFWGIDLAGAAASSLEFVSIFTDDIDGFVMDNVMYATGRGMSPAPVPVPAGVFLMATAMGGFALRRAVSQSRKTRAAA